MKNTIFVHCYFDNECSYIVIPTTNVFTLSFRQRIFLHCHFDERSEEKSYVISLSFFSAITPLELTWVAKRFLIPSGIRNDMLGFLIPIQSGIRYIIILFGGTYAFTYNNAYITQCSTNILHHKCKNLYDTFTDPYCLMCSINCNPTVPATVYSKHDVAILTVFLWINICFWIYIFLL